MTDLSWLVQLNGSKSRVPTAVESPHESKSRKPERMNKPLAVVNGQAIRPSLPACTSHQQQYSNEENQCYSPPTLNSQPWKRKLDSAHTHPRPTKRFHAEQTLPVYPPAPFASDSYYFEPAAPPSAHQRTCLLLKNDPSLSETMPPVHLPANLSAPMQLLEHESIYSDDIEHLLDIFKHEVELIGLDPIASTSAGDCTLDMGHCVSSNDFCSY